MRGCLEMMHMVQNQMTPSYPPFSQPAAGIEDYQQAIPITTQAPTVTQLTTVTDPQSQFKDPQSAQTAVVSTNGVEQQTAVNSFQQTDLDSVTATSEASSSAGNTGPKRLHVSNIPFRFREADLRNLLGQFGNILDVEIIFNERGSKGFGFVTFANSADADRAREKLNGTVVEGRKIEVNNATARVMTKKATTPGAVANGELDPSIDLFHSSAAALRGAAFTRGRVRGPYPTAAAAAAAAAAFRQPTPLATHATGLPYATIGYQDPFLSAAYAERYQPYAAGYAAAATRYAIPTVATAATYAATGGAVLSSYGGREYAAEPYIGHSIGPVSAYGQTPAAIQYGLNTKASLGLPLQGAVYRAGYQRFAPY